MEATTRESLALFVEKAEEMHATGFWRFFHHGQEIGFSFRLDRETGLMKQTAYTGPDTEALAAVLLPLRMFLQQNDRISIPALRRLLRQDGAALPAHLRTQLRSELVQADRQLDEPLWDASEVRTVPELLTRPGGQLLTHRDVLKTFLYGHYAHMDEELRPRYLSWKHSQRFGFFEFTFVATVAELVCTIFNVADLLRAELGHAAS